MADDRKLPERDNATTDLLKMPLLSSATSAADSVGKTSYSLWLQLQYQKQLAALETTFIAAAAHGLSQPSPHCKKGPLQSLHASPYALSPGLMTSSVPNSQFPYPYKQPGFANEPVQRVSAGVATCSATCMALLTSANACQALSHWHILSACCQQEALLCLSCQIVHVQHHLSVGVLTQRCQHTGCH